MTITESTAWDAGWNRALSLDPGALSLQSATLPTAPEREAFKAGWTSARSAAR